MRRYRLSRGNILELRLNNRSRDKTISGPTSLHEQMLMLLKLSFLLNIGFSDESGDLILSSRRGSERLELILIPQTFIKRKFNLNFEFN